MASSTMSSVVFRFTSTDALQIACTLWNGRVPVSGVVQIAHGMGEHIGRYLDLIEVLVSRGFTVYGNDHRGHGRTAPSASHLGDFGEGGFDLLVEDMIQLSRIARQEHGPPIHQRYPQICSVFLARTFISRSRKCNVQYLN